MAMTSDKQYDWNYLVTNQDRGITTITIKILEYLEPRDINNFARTCRAISQSVSREKHNISKKYESVTMKFPRNEWNIRSPDSIWNQRYLKECISNRYNAILEYSNKEDFTEVNITGEVDGVLLSTWELHTTLESHDSNVDTIIELRQIAGLRYRHYSRKEEKTD